MADHDQETVIRRLRARLHVADSLVTEWEEAARAGVTPEGFRCVWDVHTAAVRLRRALGNGVGRTSRPVRRVL